MGSTPRRSTSTPGRREARDHGGRQELAGGPRVPADDRDGPVPVERARLGQDVRRRDRQVQRELCREVRVGDTTDPVGAEESCHC